MPCTEGHYHARAATESGEAVEVVVADFNLRSGKPILEFLITGGAIKMTQKAHLNNSEPTEKQKRLLSKMLQDALLEIRVVGWNGESERAADLADVFHNLPAYMYTSEFDWDLLKGSLELYQSKYPRKINGAFIDYVTCIEQIKTLTS